MLQVVFYPNDEDGGWVAEVPALPGCVTQGDTRQDAMTNVREAIETWISGAKAVGMDVPACSLDIGFCIGQ